MKPRPSTLFINAEAIKELGIIGRNELQTNNNNSNNNNGHNSPPQSKRESVRERKLRGSIKRLTNYFRSTPQGT